MDSPRAGMPCPECPTGTVRICVSPGGARYRYCTVCTAVWTLPNLFARVAR